MGGKIKIFNILLGGLAGILAVILMFQIFLSSRESTSEDEIVPFLYIQEQGRSTPEEVIEAYCKYLSENDPGQALSLFAADKLMENFHFNGTTFFCYNETILPEGPIYDNINRLDIRGEAIQQMQYFCLGLSMNERIATDFELPIPFIIDDENQKRQKIEEFLECLELDRLDTLQVIRMDRMNIDNEFWKEAHDILGADDYAEYAVLYEYNGQTYVGGVRTIRYGEEWYLYRLGSEIETEPIGPQDNFLAGMIYWINEEEYESLIRSF